jgi:GNAT superfamily N-acetyltransferase
MEIIEATWDSKVFAFECFELRGWKGESLEVAHLKAGHYTLKCAPLESKQELISAGFYYADTLIRPEAPRDQLKLFQKEGLEVVLSALSPEIEVLGRNSFEHGRFHKDPHMKPQAADQRYLNWMRDLAAASKLYLVSYSGKLAAFVCAEGGHLVLHAVAQEFRGKGLAKYLWSAVLRELYKNKEIEVFSSSVSASNLAALNLYASLGFSFKGAQEVWHLFKK